MNIETVPPRQAVGPRLAWRPVRPSRPRPDLIEDVRGGLLDRPRSLPPKYFYDAEGSRLFDAICDTPEYYLTRTEDALLAECAADIIAAVRPKRFLEFGSGASRKTRHLLSACEGFCEPIYQPFDVCLDMLLEAGSSLTRDYDWLRVDALVGDYLAGFDHLPQGRTPALVAFLGSTIGNFEDQEALVFLKGLRAMMDGADRLLLGADRVKDPAVLHAAYNDAAGITAEFNRNVLKVINGELDADFPVEHFDHYAAYNPLHCRVEMYLVSRRHQRVRLGDLGAELEFLEGEAICTEISRKFTESHLRALLQRTGFRVVEHYQAPGAWYSLILAAPL